MKFAIGATLLSLAAVQVTAIPTANPAPDAQDTVQVGVPKLIAPKYRETAKRAIIRYPAFTLQAKGVSNPRNIWKQLLKK